MMDGGIVQQQNSFVTSFMNFPGEQLIIKMWDSLVDKGIGSLLTPWQIKREGMARLEVRRREMGMLAQLERDVHSRGENKSPELSEPLELASPISRLHKDSTEGSSLDEQSIDRVMETVARHSMNDSLRREANVASAILRAEETLSSDPQEPPDKTIDDDWLYRWRDYAGEVSAEMMQDLWGRVLAGEVKMPGAFSLRCLDFLRNLSQDEAHTIAQASPFVIADCIWKGVENEQLLLTTLLELQDLGVISGVGAGTLQKEWGTTAQGKFVAGLVAYPKALVLRHEDATKRLKLPVFSLTSLGKQVIPLGNLQPNEDYLRSLGKSIGKQGFDVALCDVVPTSASTFRTVREERI